jgi:hypothetical protein
MEWQFGYYIKGWKVRAYIKEKEEIMRITSHLQHQVVLRGQK